MRVFRSYICLLGVVVSLVILEVGFLETVGVKFGWSGVRRLILGVLVEFGLGEGNCFCLIFLFCILRNIEILGCYYNICILGYCGWDLVVVK